MANTGADNKNIYPRNHGGKKKFKIIMPCRKEKGKYLVKINGAEDN